MKIRLAEIPDEGRSYLFDRESGELDQALEDIIGKHDYSIDMTIKPIGNAYEMRGTVKTTLDEVCSKCGTDFELGVNRRFNEIIFKDETDHRKTQGVHGNQSVDFNGEGPSMIPVRGNIFDAADYGHEAIALAEPFYPTCGPNETCLHAKEVEEILERLEIEAAEAVGEPTNPFAALKGFGLEAKN